MFPLKTDEIQNLSEDAFEKLSILDSKGIFPLPGEDIEAFRKRLAGLENKLTEFHAELAREGHVKIMNILELNADEKIGKEIIEEAAAITRKLYSFSVDWAPGFFLSKAVGMLWGGCAISFPEDFFSFFLLRKAFQKKIKWFIYRRDELLAHELCHIARIPMGDRHFEEFLAYQTSYSLFRRYAGSCFQSKWDSILFILPVFLLLAVQIIRTFFNFSCPIWPFWVLAGVYPLFLLARNHLSRKTFFKAKKNLELAVCKSPISLLFRCSSEDIGEIAAHSGENLKKWIKDKADSEYRWKLFKFRFIDNVSHLENQEKQESI